MAVDEVRLQLTRLLITHAESFHDADPHVVVHDVGLSHQPVNDLLAGLSLQIDSEAILPTLGGEEVLGRGAQRISVQLLHLDDPCAEVGEDAICEWARDPDTEVEHEHARQWEARPVAGGEGRAQTAHRPGRARLFWRRDPRLGWGRGKPGRRAERAPLAGDLD